MKPQSRDCQFCFYLLARCTKAGNSYSSTVTCKSTNKFKTFQARSFCIVEQSWYIWSSWAEQRSVRHAVALRKNNRRLSSRIWLLRVYYSDRPLLPYPSLGSTCLHQEEDFLKNPGQRRPKSSSRLPVSFSYSLCNASFDLRQNAAISETAADKSHPCLL